MFLVAERDESAWRTTFSLIGQQLAPTSLDEVDVARLEAAAVDWRLTLDEVARACLLVELERRSSSEDFRRRVTACFRGGDTRERQAVLRALPLLSAPRELLDLAIVACRTDVVPVFAAIACDNPFPRDHFPTPAFDQLVLKAVFMGFPLGGVRGLGARTGDSLRRMASDYAAERRAAGRAVPADLHLLGVRP